MRCWGVAGIGFGVVVVVLGVTLRPGARPDAGRQYDAQLLRETRGVLQARRRYQASRRPQDELRLVVALLRLREFRVVQRVRGEPAAAPSATLPEDTEIEAALSHLRAAGADPAAVRSLEVRFDRDAADPSRDNGP